MPDPDLLSIVEALSKANVRYVVIGGIALFINGGNVVTSDIDISIAFDTENLTHLAEVLNTFDPKTRSGANYKLDHQAFGGEFVTLFTSAGVIQIVNRLSGIKSFEELYQASQDMIVRDSTVRVATLDALELMKTNTGREKDKLHLDIIRALKARSSN